MRDPLAVAGRELHERWRLLAVALVAGAVPLALPYVGFGGRDEWRAGRLWCARSLSRPRRRF